jgi:hypothetical protein
MLLKLLKCSVFAETKRHLTKNKHLKIGQFCKNGVMEAFRRSFYVFIIREKQDKQGEKL